MKKLVVLALIVAGFLCYAKTQLGEVGSASLGARYSIIEASGR
jgi:hypothetical protein